ncbi:GNAT family N-acetyltransferase [Massilia glaciei]|uniref:N-acetyltransferase n=1 Tax=Massilia glaciei TaxID=1524097 RepID=A0A2U2HLY8_9BURK|nr:GNAT family N-acetyltransferase [Massilia glaciei]PWF48517.1 N-acetyltransferase [Massilia glaciei]
MSQPQPPLVIRVLAADEAPIYREVRLRALANAPDMFCSTLASEQARPPVAWAERLAAAGTSGHDYPLVAELAGAAVGQVWAKRDADDPAVVNIFQMWVAPEGRGRGVAAALLREAINWARSKNALSVQLSVTCGGSAAARLYLREGFHDVGPATPRAGTPLFEQAMRLVLAGAAPSRPA